MRATESHSFDIEALRAVDAEKLVLGSICNRPKMLNSVRPHVEPGEFYIEMHRAIYLALIDMDEQGTPIDARTLYAELVARGLMGKEPGKKRITSSELGELFDVPNPAMQLSTLERFGLQPFGAETSKR